IVGAGVGLLWALACGGKVAGTIGTGPTPTTSPTGTTRHPPRDPPPEPTSDFPPPPPEPDPGSCPSTTPISSSDLPFPSPAPPQVGACTEADLSALVAVVPTATSDDDLKKAVSAGCAKCIFTDAESGAPWGPLPEAQTGSGAQAVTINQGGCYQLVTG